VLQEVPPEFTDTWFVLISSVTELPDSGNAAGWNADYNEAGFLVGVVAALQSDTGKIGCIGGSAIPPIVANCSGVIEGAKYIDPSVEVEVDMVGDFVDVAKATEVANAMISRGVDVLFAPAGGAAQGVIQAADEAGIYAIGYIADERFRAPDTVITSEVIDFEEAYLDLGELYTSGRLEPQIYQMTIQGGHIHYGPFGGPVKDGVEDRATEIYDMILSGDLEVPHVIHEEIGQ
jgi:basic membrane protein A